MEDRAQRHLEIGFELDRRWHALRGRRVEDDMDATKRPALIEIARILDESGLPWAIIGGVALQIHRSEPRTTLDIDVAVADRAALPRQQLAEAGFRRTGEFEHSENWVAGNGTPVQFTDDPALRDAIGRAVPVRLDESDLRVPRAADLLREKLRAGTDPGRRRSKRFQDLADVLGLLEDDPTLAEGLSDDERRIVEGLEKDR